MRKTKFIEIRQEIKFDITLEDIGVVLLEPGEDKEELARMILGNLSECIAYMTAIPTERMNEISPELKAKIHKHLVALVEKFNNQYSWRDVSQ